DVFGGRLEGLFAHGALRRREARCDRPDAFVRRRIGSAHDPGQRRSPDPCEFATVDEREDLPRLSTRAREPRPRRPRTGVPELSRPADPLGDTRRHQQRGAVPGLRRSALHHRCGAPGGCRQLPEVKDASMTLANDTDVYYDPYDTGIIANPYPVYARLREEAPIYYNERYDFWA